MIMEVRKLVEYFEYIVLLKMLCLKNRRTNNNSLSIVFCYILEFENVYKKPKIIFSSKFWINQ